ncbi:MAG: glycosyltransferase family 1 protein [Taibaiella sp.]|nr:glycosyltransferase family 1 protein [Taibaiella sp.]
MEDIIVFSHLRWHFVFQRPQHIMSRLAKHYRIIFIEEALFSGENDGYDISYAAQNIWVIQPHLKTGDNSDITERKRAITDLIIDELDIVDYVAWYYTPMSYAFSNHLHPHAIIYDCMDELSAFLFAPPELISNEADLLEAADIVFTGGFSLYEAKKGLHPVVYCMPSSIDKVHFLKAREPLEDPDDQAEIGFPRFGFFGVIDERMDTTLLQEVAKEKPEWQFIIIGPVVKIDEKHLPRLSNIHYLGMKRYQELPSYISHWQIAFLPFAMNESTRYISPTKTPEYLAAGKPVISTPIRDIVRMYGKNNLVSIAKNANEFIAAGEDLLMQADDVWLAEVDEFLSTMSWDNTVAEMNECLQNVIMAKKEKV